MNRSWVENKESARLLAARFGRRGLGKRLAAAAAAWALLAGPAGAVTVDDLSPLYFQGLNGYGFDIAATQSAGRTADFSATAADRWIDAPGPKIAIAQRVETIHQAPAVSSLATPAIVDSIWTVTNVGAGDLIAPLLVFTSLDPLAPSGTARPLQGLDANLLALLAYSNAGADYLFPAAALPDLQQGESAEFTLRYVIASALPASSSSQLLAPLGVSLLGGYATVPEPSTLLLLAVGLTVTCTRGFRRRRSATPSGGYDSSR
jgi:hypothetical protein